MEHTTGEFFVEHEADDVTGFAIVDTDETEGYRIAEKWERPDEAVWLTYWISEEALAKRQADGKCEKARDLNAKQLRGIGNLADVEVAL